MAHLHRTQSRPRIAQSLSSLISACGPRLLHQSDDFLGNRSVTVVPDPGMEASSMDPCNAVVTILWTIAIPNPVPPLPRPVVKKGISEVKRTCRSEALRTGLTPNRTSAVKFGCDVQHRSHAAVW